MKTNDIKKGIRFQLRNGWYATMMDNLKGNTRMARVEGYETEIGSVYSHDIMLAETAPGSKDWEIVEHTPAQIKLREQVGRYF